MELTNSSLIVGIFRDQVQVDRARYELRRAGFRDDQITSKFYHFGSTGAVHHAVELGSEQSRIVVAVRAEDRDRDALRILMNNGANNIDLPAGIVFQQGALVRSRG